MTKYRIFTNGKKFRIKKRVLFSWGWVKHPEYPYSQPRYTLDSLEQVVEYIDSEDWELITSANIDAFRKE